MHVGKAYRTSEFILWSRRKIFVLLAMSTWPILLYVTVGFKGFSVPWSVVLLLGTTVALVTGFKNTQTYNRSVEAQLIWASITTSSRVWGGLCRDFLSAEEARKLIYRHVAWLTALRFALRAPRAWETSTQKANVEYERRYCVPEKVASLHDEIGWCAAPTEIEPALAAANPATRLLYVQGASLKGLLDSGALSIQAYLEMLKVLRELHDQQSRSERIKNFPYPRQYAVISALFVTIFCTLLPFGMISQFEAMNGLVDGFMKGSMVWLAIPFSVVIGWMYTSLDQVGESTSNPFEGGANDVPISQISRMIEIELREALGETELPAPLLPVNGIAM